MNARAKHSSPLRYQPFKLTQPDRSVNGSRMQGDQSNVFKTLGTLDVENRAETSIGSTSKQFKRPDFTFDGIKKQAHFGESGVENGGKRN